MKTECRRGGRRGQRGGRNGVILASGGGVLLGVKEMFWK